MYLGSRVEGSSFWILPGICKRHLHHVLREFSQACLEHGLGVKVSRLKDLGKQLPALLRTVSAVTTKTAHHREASLLCFGSETSGRPEELWSSVEARPGGMLPPSRGRRCRSRLGSDCRETAELCGTATRRII